MRRPVLKMFCRAVSLLSAVFALGGCMVHEWPDESIPAVLEVEMVFDTEFQPLRDVEYAKKTKANPED